MKVEYLAAGSEDCPLIRLYDFDEAEVQQFREVVRSLMAYDHQIVVLHDEVWVESVGGCCLRLRRDKRDEGVRQLDLLNFECVLSSDGWKNVEGLLEPFCSSSAAEFQWLTRHGRVPLLISRSGEW